MNNARSMAWSNGQLVVENGELVELKVKVVTHVELVEMLVELVKLVVKGRTVRKWSDLVLSEPALLVQ